MARVTWRGAAVAGLLVAVAGGCAHGEKRQAAAPQTPAQRAQQSAEGAARQAASAEQQLVQARQRLEAAHQERIKAEQQRAQSRQQLQQAEERAAAAGQRIGQEQANVARLEQAAREQREAATEAAIQAQLVAEEAQGLRSATGRIAQATPSRVVLEVPGGRSMSFDVDPRTRVMVGIEQRSVADLQQGAEARVAYDPREQTPAAVVIHVSSARNRPPAPPTQAAPGQAAPGQAAPGQQQAPQR